MGCGDDEGLVGDDPAVASSHISATRIEVSS